MARPKKRIKDMKFTLRLSPGLYERVRATASALDTSMNDVIGDMIVHGYSSGYVPLLADQGPAHEALARESKNA